MSKPIPGLFITKGMNVSVPEFSLGLNEKGEMTLNNTAEKYASREFIQEFSE